MPTVGGYYLRMLVVPAMFLLFAGLAHLLGGQAHLLATIVGSVFAFLVAGNLLGARQLIAPVRRFLEEGGNAEAAMRRLRRLPLLSSVWIGLLASLAWLLLIVNGLEDLPAGGLSVPVNRSRIGADLWRLAIGAVYFPMLVWFVVSQYTADLRRYLFETLGLVVHPQGTGLGTRIVIVGVILALLPLLTILLDLTVFELGRRSRGLTMVDSVLLDVMLFGLAVTVALFFIRSYLTRPIASLMEGVRRVARGDFSAKVPVVSDDEIGELTARLNDMTDALAERELIRDTFGKYVPRELVAPILAEHGRLHGERRLATIMFTDISGFTSIAETLSPEDTVALLNGYYDAVFEVIERHGGVIANLIGDGVFAVFNVPAALPDHAARAVQAALEIQALCAARTFGPGLRLPTRIGINTGEVVAGSVGGQDRLGYTLLGDEVNVAARAEQLSKDYDNGILITAPTHALAGDGYDCEDLGILGIRGKRESVHLYKVLGTAGAAA